MNPTAAFITYELANNRVLISGTDVRGFVGEVVVDGTQWAEVKQTEVFKTAAAAYDAEVEAFFQPLTDAAEAVTSALAGDEPDPVFSVLLEEAQEGQHARPEHRLTLTHDSVVLRLIESGQADRLIWVNGQLEILSA